MIFPSFVEASVRLDLWVSLKDGMGLCYTIKFILRPLSRAMKKIFICSIKEIDVKLHIRDL